MTLTKDKIHPYLTGSIARQDCMIIFLSTTPKSNIGMVTQSLSQEDIPVDAVYNYSNGISVIASKMTVEEMITVLEAYPSIRTIEPNLNIYI